MTKEKDQLLEKEYNDAVQNYYDERGRMPDKALSRYFFFAGAEAGGKEVAKLYEETHK